MNFLKPNYSLPVIHLVFFFLISDQGHYTFLYGYGKHNREGGGKEQTNKHGLALIPSESRRKYMWHFYAALRAFAGYRRRVFCAKLQQSHQEYWLISWLLCFQLLTASFCWLCPSLNSYLKLTALFCTPWPTTFPCLLWDLPSLVYLRPCAMAFCVGFAPKQTKRSCEWHQQKRKRNATHRVTFFITKLFLILKYDSFRIS